MKNKKVYIMWVHLVFLLLLTTTCFALQPLENTELESANVAKGIIAPIQNFDLANSPELPTGKVYLTDEQKQFHREVEKSTGKIQTIYKGQIKKHNLPNSECIRFNFQIERTGVVKIVEAEKKDISIENAELISGIISMFEKTLFSSRSSDYSETYKFCFINSL